MQPASQQSRNRLALVILVVGKVLGVAGLVVGSAHRVAGGLLLGLDAVFVIAAVVICITTMKAREREDRGDKAMLAQMKREGTLKQYLRELEDEERRDAV